MRFRLTQDVASAGLLDITNNETVTWLRGRLRAVSDALGGDDNVVFYVDSGNAFHTPTYFQVICILVYFYNCFSPFKGL